MLPQGRSFSLWRTIKAVLWSFIGLRSRAEFNKDLAAVGLVLAIVFVLGLVALVNWVVSQPVTL